MFRWIANNYRTFLWALALAIAVWLAAVTGADPDETRALTTSIPVEIIGQDPSLVINGEIPSEVRITLRAPRSVWNLINADPKLIRAILDLSGLAIGEHNAELQIQVNARPVQIVSASPQSVVFSLEPLATKTLVVDLTISGEAAIGYQIGEPVLQPTEVVIAGPESQIETVARARVAVSLDGIREELDQTIPVQILEETGRTVTGLTVTPDSVHVNLPVSQQGGYRDLAVKIVITGRVASGYRLTDISVFPPVVTVFATDPELVNNLPGVLETMPLDLQNVQEDINTRLALNLPSGISIVGEQTVLVQAGISAIESSVTLAGQKVEIIGLTNGENAQVSPATVDVIVSGPLPLLDLITAQDVSVTVDLTGLQPGTHQVTPQVEVLISDVSVESILPATIEVVITAAGVPTGTPNP
jgi:YbbR domain-containing protein